MKSVDEQLTILKRGLIDLISEEELKAKLQMGRPLRIKYGADPSSPDLHLGHTVPLRKLRQFQEYGHKVVFLVGDFTARIGDPSQQSETRKMLSEEQIQENAKTYQDQVFRILDRKKTEVHYNSEWLDRFKPNDFLKLTAQYTVARLLERDDFKNRYEEKRPIAVLEFLYPLLQGYDSVVVKADVELGGTDQKFNMLVGRDLQRDAGQEPQVVMTLPIIEGTDGTAKMSKSLGNAIGLESDPADMFGKAMSIPDHLIVKYWTYLTGASAEEVGGVERRLADGSLHPREAKAQLAHRLVALFHGAKKADEARDEFDRVFRSGELPSDLVEYTLEKRHWDIVSLLSELGLASSRSEARRLVKQGGVKIDQAAVTDVKQMVSLDKEIVIQCGKRRFAKVKAKS